jgi:glycosyltransferase involved in cell wall biosynthesis
MKINFTLVGIGCTGGVKTFFELSDVLIRKGHEVYITTLGGNIDWVTNKNIPKIIIPNGIKNNKENSIYKLIKRNKIAKESIKKLIKIVSPSYLYKRTINTLDKNNKILVANIPDCDINVATYHSTAYAVLNSKKGIPVYYMQHFEPYFYPDNYPNNEKMKKYALDTYFLKMNRISNSAWLHDKLKNEYNVESTLITPGVRLNSEFHLYNNKDKNSKIVLCMGKDIELKGFKDAIKAMEIVFAKENNVKWLVYGTKKPKIESKKAPYEFIKFPSDLELAKLYSKANVVFVPSWYESFPLPPLEAMACGTPVVTIRYGTEDYAIDGENALIVESRNTEAMAEAILRIFHDRQLSEKLIQNGLETPKKHNWEKTANRVEKYFLELLKEKRKK